MHTKKKISFAASHFIYVKCDTIYIVTLLSSNIYETVHFLMYDPREEEDTDEVGSEFRL